MAGGSKGRRTRRGTSHLPRRSELIGKRRLSSNRARSKRILRRKRALFTLGETPMVIPGAKSKMEQNRMRPKNRKTCHRMSRPW